MRILAIDTSTRIGSVALADQGKLLACSSLETTKGHAKFLLPSIYQLCKQLTWTVGQVDLIACATGPGSFASLRIGISTAKGIAFATGASTIGVNTLEAMARPFAFLKMNICPVLDAKKDQVYSAFFNTDGQGNLHRSTEDMLLFPEQLVDKIEDNTLLFGEGALLYKHVFCSKVSEQPLFAPTQLWYHIGGAVAIIGEEKAQSGQIGDTLVPNYIRPPDAVAQKIILERSPNGDSRREADRDSDQ